MISVILPTYNRLRTLPRAIGSVLAQEEPLELIVVDDGSDDGTEAWLASYPDPRVRYVRMPERSGACAARNRGVQLARGEYVAFQDSDDEWRPGKLRAQRAYLEGTGADVVFCAFERMVDGRSEGTIPPPEIAAGPVTYGQLLFQSLCSTQTILGRRECFLAEPFDETFPRLQDWELMLRMVQRYDVRYTGETYATVYEQPDSISRRPEKLLEALRRLNEMHRPALSRDDRLLRQMTGNLADISAKCGINPWRDCLRAMSPHVSPMTNAILAAKAALWLVRARGSAP